MKIIILENLDDFKDDYLDYDEDKYYLVNSFKEFKKYGHKDKHLRDIQAITSNYKNLLDDLEYNNIYINDEFKDIKDSDLDKENNYFILPHIFMNNIIEQLGYKPNKMRTYKNETIGYKGKDISISDFEGIINNNKSEYHWLSKCVFKDIDIMIYKGDGGIVLNSGIILDGVFDGRNIETLEIINCTWKGGTLINGVVKDNSVWENGILQNSSFGLSTWKHGTWIDSVWYIDEDTKYEGTNKDDFNSILKNSDDILFEISYDEEYDLEYILSQNDILTEILENNFKKNDYIDFANKRYSKKDIEDIIEQNDN